MNFDNNISLQGYADAANRQFGETENRLSQIAGSFQTRMNGKSRAGILVSLIATGCWVVAVCVFFAYIKDSVNSALHLLCFGIALALLGVLLLDEITSFSYYGKIASYRDGIDQLLRRVTIGKSSIKTNQDAYMQSRSDGWQHPLPVGASIPEEADSIETAINGMESLKAGFVSKLKNFLFFLFAGSVTAIGCMALFETASDIITELGDTSLEYSTLSTLCIIAMLITVVGEIILAKLVWSMTNCSVTNVTLLVAVLGPVLFLALVAIVTLLVQLVVWAVSALLAIAALVIAGACVCGSLSGG